MKYLSFGFAGKRAHGKRIRSAQFEERSAMPVPAACAVAAGVREALAAMLGSPVDVRLLEPVVPSPQAWAAIVAGALLYRVRGDLADAAIVLRKPDALALAAGAFGEAAAGARTPPRELSAMERDVLDRAVAAFAGCLRAACGPGEPAAFERVASIAGFVTYFELIVERPVEARIGIALSRDPLREPVAGLRLADLAGIPIAASVVVDVGSIPAGTAASLRAGTILPIPRTSALRGRLCLAGRTLAEGTCGVSDGRYALMTTGGGFNSL